MYAAMIHCYRLGGLNIVLDVYSGSVHVVDDAVYDIIGMYETSSPEEIKAAVLEKNTAARRTVNRGGNRRVLREIEALKKRRESSLRRTALPDLAGSLKETRGRCESALPPHCAHLQPQLRVLLCKPGGNTAASAP